MLSADGKSAVLCILLDILLLKYAISRCYIFPDGSVWFMGNLVCLCDVPNGWSYLNIKVSVSSIFNCDHFYFKYYFLRYWNSLSKRFSKESIATSLFSIFIHQSTKSTSTGLNIYSILGKHPKALLKMFLIDVDILTLPRHPQDVIFEHIF